MSETDVTAILNAITSMRSEVMGKIETIFTEIKGLCDRVTVLEGDKIARDATNRVENKIEKEKLDWGKWFVRSISAAAAFALSVFAWKLLTGTVKIIEVVK